MSRRFWTAALSRSTCSLVDATTATVSPLSVTVDPGGGDRVEVLVQGAGDDPPVRLVGVECSRVAGPQQQRGVGFPAVGEPVDVFELVDPAVAAQLVEQAAPADGLQLAGVADQHQPPLVAAGRG